MRRTPTSTDRCRKFSLDTEATSSTSPGAKSSDESEAPIWGALRQKIFSFVRSRSRSPTNRSPGSKSPGSRSPTGFKSSFNSSPASKSPITKSPMSKSPSSKSPTIKSPSIRTPSPSRGSSGGTPPHTHRSSPPSASIRRSSFSKSARESRSSSGEAELLFVSSRRGSIATSHNQKKMMGLSLKRDATDSMDSNSETPGTNSPGTPSGFKKTRNKLKGSPEVDLQKMDDDLRLAEAALRPRKWSYHGAASPSAPVEAPKRHSFSTASGHQSGIVVSNNDLAKLLGQNRLLLPGLPLGDMFPLPVLPNPKARGRSQSIAVCAQFTKGKLNEPIAPVLIKTIDCDHLASIQANDSLDKEDLSDEDPEKLMWDSSGSTVNVNLLGSVIEKYLQTSNQDEEDENSDNNLEEDQCKEEPKVPSSEADENKKGSSASLTTSFKGLQVK